MHNLNLVYPNFSSARKLDPAKIETLVQYDLLSSLYSQLLTFDVNNQIVLGVPESMKWQDNELIFTFGNKVKTIDGHVINADDAAISLKRNIFLKKSGHGDLRNLLCPLHALKSIHDECPGVRVEENKLILTVADKKYQPFLMPFLSSTDFSIIPKDSLDLNSKDIKIISYRNTSGPYYLEKDDDGGALMLAANPNHYLYDKNMPQMVNISPATTKTAIAKFENDPNDLLPIVFTFSYDQISNLLAKSSEFNIEQSLPFQVSFVEFTPKALKDFTPEQRMFAGKMYHERYLSKFDTPGSKPTVEFFQILSDGSLNQAAKKDLQDWRNNLVKPKFTKPIELAVSDITYDQVKESLKDIPEIKVVNTHEHPFKLNVKDRKDMYFARTDSAWAENLSILGYSLREGGAFHLPGLDGQQWVRDYIAIDSRELRIEKLRKLHEELLRQVVIYPYSVSSYYSVAKKPWTMNFSTYTAGIQLWRMRYQP
ncbi:MAG: hypothetical protein ACOYOK_14940 [Pseudobdellovibrionaceae bacterium]